MAPLFTGSLSGFLWSDRNGCLRCRYDCFIGMQRAITRCEPPYFPNGGAVDCKYHLSRGRALNVIGGACENAPASQAGVLFWPPLFIGTNLSPLIAFDMPSLGKRSGYDSDDRSRSSLIIVVLSAYFVWIISPSAPSVRIER
jgi:hypothetical protein